MFTINVKNVFSTTLTTEMLIKLMPLTLHFHHFTIGRHHCFQLPVEKKNMTKKISLFLFMVIMVKKPWKAINLCEQENQNIYNFGCSYVINLYYLNLDCSLVSVFL